MGALGVEQKRRLKASSTSTAGFASAKQMREVLDRLLTEVDSDPTVGPRLRATHVPQRFVFPDVGLVLNVTAATESQAPRCLRWAFDDKVEWTPALTLEMDSDVANRYLQGRENIAIAIARRKIRASCNARAALNFLPASGGLIERYTKIIERSYPQLKET
jgi:hypothetical protein